MEEVFWGIFHPNGGWAQEQVAEELLESPSLEMLMAWLEKALSKLLRWSCFGQDNFQVSLPAKVILRFCQIEEA